MKLNFQNFEDSLFSLVQNFKEKKFLLAVSGGADSMVLLHLFSVFRRDHGGSFHLQVAHINYNLRGEDSDLDQKVVEDFCKENNVKLHVYKVSEEEKPENSIQIWARELRYQFFSTILKAENLDFTVTAHHLNDELETFLINLSRGSGIRGLSGIPENENKILRPLLNFTKKEIYTFAKEENVEFREDLSNKKNDYLRNKFRNSIIPEIENAVPNFLQNFQDSLHYLKNANSFIQNEIENAFYLVLINSSETEIILDKRKLFSLKPFLINEIILKFGFRGEEIQKIASSENGKMFRSKTHEIFIGRDEIRCVAR